MNEQPQNKDDATQAPRPEDDGKDLVSKVVNEANGRNEYGQLLPGHTANPGGRPKTRPFRAAILKHLREHPDKFEALIAKAVDMAVLGDDTFFKELRDMVDGKPAIQVTGADEGPLEVNLSDARAKLLAALS